jgi:hypothetical protein
MLQISDWKPETTLNSSSSMLLSAQAARFVVQIREQFVDVFQSPRSAARRLAFAFPLWMASLPITSLDSWIENLRQEYFNI